jgi:hypothetical protein
VPSEATTLKVLAIVAVLVTNKAAGMLNKLATVPVPLFVKRMKEAFVQVPPEAKLESA